jgi:hypothetical protein
MAPVTHKGAAAGALARRAEAPAPSKRADFGAVPAYLKARQAEWAAAEDAKKAAAAASDVPPGMRVMGEAERADTLAMLAAGIADTKAALSAMKLHVDVPSHIRRKADLEAKLAKLEAAVGVFSRPRVFVNIDETR